MPAIEAGETPPRIDRESGWGYPIMSFWSWAVRHGCEIKHIDHFTVIHDPFVTVIPVELDRQTMQARTIEALQHPTSPHAEAAAPYLRVA